MTGECRRGCRVMGGIEQESLSAPIDFLQPTGSKGGADAGLNSSSIETRKARSLCLRGEDGDGRVVGLVLAA